MRDVQRKVEERFAKPSVSDRIAFADWIRSNQTASGPAEKKAKRSAHAELETLFLPSGLGRKLEELRRFPAIFRGTRA
jgi:hypothetical protein